MTDIHSDLYRTKNYISMTAYPEDGTLSTKTDAFSGNVSW